ncbi:MAG: Hpt domain-containing protein, partial [Thioalkalivibrio sp.]
MSLDTDDEILQDFLVEAGELLDGLSEQLVELERNPTDKDLLNSVFRSFHTIKGGAGFLNLTHLVAVCHRAEDVFNVLRQGQRQVDGELMDAVLEVLDVVTRMFNETRAGTEPGPADPGLLKRLESMTGPADAPPLAPAPVAAAPAPAQAPSPAPAATLPAGDGDIPDDEFEALLDAMQSGGEAPAVPAAPAGGSGG